MIRPSQLERNPQLGVKSFCLERHSRARPRTPLSLGAWGSVCISICQGSEKNTVKKVKRKLNILENPNVRSSDFRKERKRVTKTHILILPLWKWSALRTEPSRSRPQGSWGNKETRVVTDTKRKPPFTTLSASAAIATGTRFKPPHHDMSTEKPRPTKLKEHHLQSLAITISVRVCLSHHWKGPKIKSPTC